MIRQIEQAIVSWLRDKFANADPALEAEIISGAGREYIPATEALEQPTLWVVFNGTDPIHRLSTTSWRLPVRYSIVIAANALTDKQIEQPDVTTLSVYELLNKTMAFLVGQQFGLPILPLELYQILPLHNDRNILRLDPWRLTPFYEGSIGTPAVTIYSLECKTAIDSAFLKDDVPYPDFLGVIQQ